MSILSRRRGTAIDSADATNIVDMRGGRPDLSGVTLGSDEAAQWLRTIGLGNEGILYIAEVNTEGSDGAGSWSEYTASNFDGVRSSHHQLDGRTIGHRYYNLAEQQFYEYVGSGPLIEPRRRTPQYVLGSSAVFLYNHASESDALHAITEFDSDNRYYAEWENKIWGLDNSTYSAPTTGNLEWTNSARLSEEQLERLQALINNIPDLGEMAAFAARAERVYFNRLTAIGTTDKLGAIRTMDPIDVRHGSGDPNLLAVGSSQNILRIRKAGVYLIQISGTLDIVQTGTYRALPRVRLYNGTTLVSEVDDHFHFGTGQPSNLQISGYGSIYVPTDNYDLTVRVANDAGSNITFHFDENWTLTFSPLGVEGMQGPQGVYDLPIYRNYSHDALPTSPPTGGTFTFATGLLTNLPTGWSLNPSTPGAGERTIKVFTRIDYANQPSASYTPTWSAPLPETGAPLTGDGLSTDDILNLIHRNVHRFTFSDAFPTSPATGGLHYFTSANNNITAQDADGGAITEAAEGQLFRYNGSAWVLIYSFRTLIELLIAMNSLYFGEYRANTEIPANRIVTHNNDIFWTIAAILDTNTTAPASNSSFVQLNGGTSGITAQQFLAAMPDYLKVRQVEISPPYIDPNNVPSELNFHIITAEDAFSELGLRVRLPSNSIDGNIISISGNEHDYTLTLTDAQRTALKTHLETDSKVDVNIEWGTGSRAGFVVGYIHDLYLPRADVLPYPSQVIAFETYPAFLEPNNVPSRIGAHVNTLSTSFPEVENLRFAINGEAGSPRTFTAGSANDPFVSLNATQISAIETLLTTLNDVPVSVDFLNSDGDSIYTHNSVIPKQSVGGGGVDADAEIFAARAERVYFNALTGISNTEQSAVVRTSTPIDVRHGSGANNLIATVSGQTGQIEIQKAGIYELHLDGTIDIQAGGNTRRTLPRVRLYNNANLVAEVDDHYHRTGNNANQRNDQNVSGDGIIYVPTDNYVVTFGIANEIQGNDGSPFDIDAGWSLTFTPFGVQGIQGEQGRFDLAIYRNYAADSIPTAAPTGGTFTYATGRLTDVPTGWSINPSTPSSGERTVKAITTIDYANQPGATINPTWSAPIPETGEPGTGGDGSSVSDDAIDIDDPSTNSTTVAPSQQATGEGLKSVRDAIPEVPTTRFETIEKDGQKGVPTRGDFAGNYILYMRGAHSKLQRATKIDINFHGIEVAGDVAWQDDELLVPFSINATDADTLAINVSSTATEVRVQITFREADDTFVDRVDIDFGIGASYANYLVLLTWDETRTVTTHTLPENYTAYRHFRAVLRDGNHENPVSYPITALQDARRDDTGNAGIRQLSQRGGEKLEFNRTTRVLSGVGTNVDGITYLELFN